MRNEAVSDCLSVLRRFGIDPAKGAAIDVGGTREVYLSDHGHLEVTENPLLKVNPSLVLLDRGFNAEHLGTGSDEEVDFLMEASIRPLFEQFDLVFCFDTLEHTSNPFLFCDHLLRVVKPSGFVYLSTIFSWVYHPSPEDYFRFSPKGLEACFVPVEASSRARILWAGWENDERGVSILVQRAPFTVEPDRDFSIRSGVGKPGMLPSTKGGKSLLTKLVRSRR